LNEYQLRNAMTTYGDTVFRLALCRMQNTADAEDVYQDVFLRFMRQETEDWEREHIRAWLIRTTVNRCNDLHRFRLRRQTLPLDALAELTAPNRELDGGEGELWTAVANLPTKLRTVIHLHYAEGYATEEIAKLLDIPAATVRTRLHRARGKLKDLLGGMDDER